MPDVTSIFGRSLRVTWHFYEPLVLENLVINNKHLALSSRKYGALPWVACLEEYNTRLCKILHDYPHNPQHWRWFFFLQTYCLLLIYKFLTEIINWAYLRSLHSLWYVEEAEKYVECSTNSVYKLDENVWTIFSPYSYICDWIRKRDGLFLTDCWHQWYQ